MPPRARGIGAAWGGKIRTVILQGSRPAVTIKLRAAAFVSWGRQSLPRPVGLNQLKYKLYLIVVDQVANAPMPQSGLVGDNQDVGQIHNEIVFGIANIIALVDDAIEAAADRSAIVDVA